MDIQKIAMFGGSFNPVHNAHIKLTQKIKEVINPDLILAIPTFTTPLKDNSSMVSADHRLNMCKLAWSSQPFVKVSDIEIARGGKSYTADTLEILQSQYPNARLYLIVGADMFMSVQDWYRTDKIFKISTLVVAPRDKTDYKILSNHSNFLQKFGAESIVLADAIMELSSTFIRDSIKNGADVSEFLPANVLEYIDRNNLYR